MSVSTDGPLEDRLKSQDKLLIERRGSGRFTRESILASSGLGTEWTFDHLQHTQMSRRQTFSNVPTRKSMSIDDLASVREQVNQI
jgi:hypothetical protein